MEYYLNKLAEIIGSENPRTPYEIRELALDNLLQFLRIPSFAAELYINYDCNLYCTNLLEDLVKLLSKNSLSATQAIYTIHEISLDGLMTIVSDVEKKCSQHAANQATTTVNTVAIIGGRHSRNNSTADKIKLENNVNNLNIATSGGEESGKIENIHSFISKKNVSMNRNDDSLNETSTDSNDKSQKNDFVTHDQLTVIKNQKRVSFHI